MTTESGTLPLPAIKAGERWAFIPITYPCQYVNLYNFNKRGGYSFTSQEVCYIDDHGRPYDEWFGRLDYGDCGRMVFCTNDSEYVLASVRDELANEHQQDRKRP